MANVGSSYGTMKRAIRDKLAARPALSARVAVSYESPFDEEDTTGPTGHQEAIYFQDAAKPGAPASDGDQENKVICALPLQIDERYELPLWIQVIIPFDDGTQEVADARVDEILYEVLDELATDPSFGIGATLASTNFQYLHCTKAVSFERFTGQLGNTRGHGSGCKLTLEVQSRLSFV